MRYTTPKLVKALRKPDLIENKKTVQGFQVFQNAFESYFEDGYLGSELQSKALSQYTNWAA